MVICNINALWFIMVYNLADKKEACLDNRLWVFNQLCHRCLGDWPLFFLLNVALDQVFFCCSSNGDLTFCFFALHQACHHAHQQYEQGKAAHLDVSESEINRIICHSGASLRMKEIINFALLVVLTTTSLLEWAINVSPVFSFIPGKGFFVVTAIQSYISDNISFTWNNKVISGSSSSGK